MVYKHALEGLLTQLDALESGGDEEVRVARRAVVKEKEMSLEGIEKNSRMRGKLLKTMESPVRRFSPKPLRRHLILSKMRICIHVQSLWPEPRLRNRKVRHRFRHATAAMAASCLILDPGSAPEVGADYAADPADDVLDTIAIKIKSPRIC